MAVWLSALLVDRTLPPKGFVVLISVTDRISPRATMQLKGLDQMINSAISSGIEPATFRLVAQCLNNLISAGSVHIARARDGQ
jgi:hypothetical protein